MKLAKRLLEADETTEQLAAHLTRVLDQNVRHVLDIWAPSKVMNHVQSLLKTFKLKIEFIGEGGFPTSKDNEDRTVSYEYSLLSTASNRPTNLRLEIYAQILDGRFKKFRYKVKNGSRI